MTNPFKEVLICDILSSDTQSSFAQIQRITKRRVEVRLGLVLLMLRFKKDISKEECLQHCLNFDTFFKFFEKEMETVKQLIPVYLGKKNYSVSELKEEIGSDILFYLRDIENFEMALMASKKLNLKDRLDFMIAEKMLIESDKPLEDVIVESQRNLVTLMEVSSEDIEALSKQADMTKNVYKFIGDGWAGEVAVFGDSFETTEEVFLQVYEQKEKNGNLAEYWMADEMGNYVRRTNFNCLLTVMEPQFEDFMIETIKK